MSILGFPNASRQSSGMSEEEARRRVGVGKKSLTIDFEALEELLLDEESSIEEKYDPVNGLSRDNSQRRSPTAFSNSYPSKLFLHSSFKNSIFLGTNFKDLSKSGQQLPQIFGQNPDDAWWLDMQNPTDREVRKLCAAFGVHPLTIEDILRQESSEKIEEYPTYRFASVQSFHEAKEEDEIVYNPYSVYMIIFSEGILSFCFNGSEHSVHVEERITKFEDHVSIKSNWVFYAFVDDIVDSFGPLITQIEKEVNQIDDQVYATRSDDMKNFLWEIEAIRRRVLSLIRLLGGKSNVLRTFENHHYVTTSADTEIQIYINDVQDHVDSMVGSLHQFEGLLSRSKSSYLAQLEISSSTERFKVFKILARMAVLSLILTFMTLCSNMFGQNVNANVPLYMRENVLAFFMIVLGETILASLLFLGAKKWGVWW